MLKRLQWQGVELQLFATKVLYIPDYHTLVLSDWHLGKLGHFRREGLFVPPMMLEEELERLGRLLHLLPIEKVVFLGDLFHSSWNYEWDEFTTYISRYPMIDFILTKGNHDVLSVEHFSKTSLLVVDSLYLGAHLVLSHEPISDLPLSTLNIVGHIHPGIVVRSKGRQHFRLPCFYFKDNILTLPAFGKWTGLFLVNKGINDRIFAIVGNELIEM